MSLSVALPLVGRRVSAQHATAKQSKAQQYRRRFSVGHVDENMNHFKLETFIGRSFVDIVLTNARPLIESQNESLGMMSQVRQTRRPSTSTVLTRDKVDRK